MRLSDLADAIKQSVTARQVADALGLQPNSAGFCRCPFHGEKTGSLKLYPGNRGWYCFGCHQGGSVIDLVMAYQGLDVRGAVEFLNNEFQLGLPIGYEPTREQEEEARRRAAERKEIQKRKEEAKRKKDEAFRRYCDVGAELSQAEDEMRQYAPRDASEDFDDRFVAAIQKIEALKEEAKDLELIVFEKEEQE